MTTEQRAKAMSRREKYAYLRDQGWRRHAPRGTPSWMHPTEPWAFLSLDAAVRHALEQEAS